MTDTHHAKNPAGIPALFPKEAQRYLAHTAEGRPLRDIAREAGCHPSTILRQVRKLETLRDDPLIDRVLTAHSGPTGKNLKSGRDMTAAIDALRLLCQPRAMMLYREDVKHAAVVQALGDGETCVLGTVALEIAAALILRNWLAVAQDGMVKRYRVTEEGRLYLSRLVATRDALAAQDADLGGSVFHLTLPDRRSRDRSVSSGPGYESPLAALARRRGPDGKSFLSNDFIAAGDRLHEDYTVGGFAEADLLGRERPDMLEALDAQTAQITDRVQREARMRTLDAVRDLGPGLSEVVLRCCCLREGLEATEKRLGWSARSGKVVLRIALQRLSLFYARQEARNPVLIG